METREAIDEAADVAELEVLLAGFFSAVFLSN
jgi:hypothetical protein